MLWSEIMERLTARPAFMEPVSPRAVTTAISPIRAPSPCEECPSGIKRSGSCTDCLAPPDRPTTPKAEDIEAAALDCLAWKRHDYQLSDAEFDEAIARLTAVGERLSERENEVGIVLERALGREEFEKCLREEAPTERRTTYIYDLYRGFPNPLETIRERTGLHSQGTWEGTVHFYDPKVPPSEEIARIRERNGGKCYQCTSDNFAVESALCWTCYIDPNPEGRPCAEGCGRTITGGKSCRPCDEREDALKREQELLESLHEDMKCEECGKGVLIYPNGERYDVCAHGTERCPGCGLEGYDDYCSRACMLEAAGQA